MVSNVSNFYMYKKLKVYKTTKSYQTNKVTPEQTMMSKVAKNGLTIEEMVENRMIWFKKNGSIDKRCSAYKSGIVDENCEIILPEIEKINDVANDNDDDDETDSDSDEEDELPSDTYFYGVLSEKIKNIDELVDVMTNGIKKYKEYMLTHNNTEILPEDLVTTLDYWFQHDSERNDYFDYLISQESAPAVAFDKVAVRILQAVEDQEKS